MLNGSHHRCWSGRCARLLIATAALAVTFGCSTRELTVDGAQREVQLDASGRVVDSTVVSTPSSIDKAPSVRPAPSTTTSPDARLQPSAATDGPAAVDCGGGATRLSVSGGTATGPNDERVTLTGRPLLDDLDGDGLDDLAAVYTCANPGQSVALSVSLWRATPQGPRRSAVSVAPIEDDWTVVLPDAPGDGRVGVTVLAPAGLRPAITTTTTGAAGSPLPAPAVAGLEAETAATAPQPVRLNPNQLPPGRQVVRQIVGVIDHGRIRVASDGPPAVSDGVDSLPIDAFPERLELDGAGLGPLRLGATEEQLTQALGLVVSRVEFPPPPPCFGSANRVLAVGPIYFGLRRGVLEAVWVTDAELRTDQRRIPLALAGTPSVEPLAVNVGLNPNAPPQGLMVAGFGGGWAALRPAAEGSAVSIVAEGPTDGSDPDRVSGFGIAERPCLRSDFSTGAAVPNPMPTTDAAP
ncbi:MAG: hypothetical protein R2754_00815 [Microthrixaceae bacterium]